MEPELRLDPAIRVWVFLPIVAITFLVGIVRHYVSVLLAPAVPSGAASAGSAAAAAAGASGKKGGRRSVELGQVRDSQTLLRARAVRENSGCIPRPSFQMRRHFFNNDESGVLKASSRGPSSSAGGGPAANPMGDPAMMTEMLKGNLAMIVIGGWINWHFSGFVTTKVPFPLTLRFKPMLQRGIELASLDASWVSSVSWYFLNFFGLRSIYSLVLTENNAADQSRIMMEQMTLQAGGMPQDPKQAFKAEWEALELTEHVWGLKNAEQEMMAALGPTPDILYHQSQPAN